MTQDSSGLSRYAPNSNARHGETQPSVERVYGKSTHGKDPNLPWLNIREGVPDNAIAMAASLLEDWVETVSTAVSKVYGATMANGISINTEDNDYLYPIAPDRPDLMHPDDPNDGDSCREAKFENDINVKVYLGKTTSFDENILKIADQATKIHALLLLQCSPLVRQRLRKSLDGAAAEEGTCPKELIKALQTTTTIHWTRSIWPGPHWNSCIISV
jgi:hypothetical protein